MVAKNREHLNFPSYSIDSDEFLLFITIGSGLSLVALSIGIACLYLKNKLTSRQLTPIIFFILISHLSIGLITLFTALILLIQY